jgi:hypothetical protein
MHLGWYQDGMKPDVGFPERPAELLSPTGLGA